MNSKALTPVVFNWVFVLIAGAVIMMFFFNIINAQTKITEKELEMRILKDMEDLLIGKSVSTDTSSTVQISNKHFVYDCAEPCSDLIGCDSSLSLKSSEASIDFNTQPLFSIRNLQATELISFASSWDIPFHAANFLYLAVPGEKIVFPANCNGLCGEVYSMIPQRYKDSRIVTQIEPTSFNFVRHVFFKIGECTSENKPHEICINQSGLFFFNNGRPDKTVNFPDGFPYFVKDSILGAIFSEDAALFECNMKKAFFKSRLTSKVLVGKTNYFIDYYSNDDWGNVVRGTYCKSDLETEILPNLDAFDTFYSNLIDTDELQNSKFILENTNRKLARKSCATIY